MNSFRMQELLRMGISTIRAVLCGDATIKIVAVCKNCSVASRQPAGLSMS